MDAIGKLEHLRDRVGDSSLNLLREAGVVRLEEGEYTVPDLYRHGLEMTRKGPR